MYDLISIGNVSIDLYFKGESLTFEKERFQLAVGGKYFAEKFYSGVGGGGANVAIGGVKEGLKVAVLGTLGNNPFKKMILHVLEEHHVSTKLCSLEDNYVNISCILLSSKGERSIVHYSTPNRHILSSTVAINQLINTKVVYLGNLPDVPLVEREVVLNFCKKNQILTVVNLGVNDCRKTKHELQSFFNKIDILILNGHEFAELVKAQYKDIHFREHVLEWYAPQLQNKIVIITEGAKGSFGYVGKKIIHVQATPVDKITDTTGAGDGYTAGFIAEFYRSKDVAKAMHAGTLYATKILKKIGAN